MPRQHIVWFVADQLRADAVGCLGNRASRTPRMDALAQEGAAFSNAYCQNPVCVPSRCSFLTGWYPHTLGHRTMQHMMREDDPDILKTMKAAGYEVVWAGRNDFVPGGRCKEAYCDHYFNAGDMEDHALDADGGQVPMGSIHSPGSPVPAEGMEGCVTPYSFYQGALPDGSMGSSYDSMCVSAVVSFIERYQGDKPLFVYCTLVNPHPPYVCERSYIDAVDRNVLQTRRTDVEKLDGKPAMLHKLRERLGLAGWTEEQWDELRATYLGMVGYFDAQLGRLVDALKARGMYDDTSLMVFSDHGDYSGDYGIVEKAQNTFEDCLTRVPLLIKPAKGVQVKPGVHDELVELVDLPATTAELAGIELPYRQFGVSLVGAFAGEYSPHDAVFCEGGRLPGEVQAMEPYREPPFPYWPRQSIQHEDGPAHLKASMIRMDNLKYVWRMAEKDELYDLGADPLELENKVDDPAYAQDLVRLQRRLMKQLIETADYVPERIDKR